MTMTTQEASVDRRQLHIGRRSDCLLILSADVLHPVARRFSSHNLEFSPSGTLTAYQPRHLPPSPQDSLFPAGLQTHLAPSSCASDSAAHCAHLKITNLLTCCYHISQKMTIHRHENMLANLSNSKRRAGSTANKRSTRYRMDCGGFPPPTMTASLICLLPTLSVR